MLEDIDVSLAAVTFDISCAVTRCKCQWYYSALSYGSVWCVCISVCLWRLV